MEQASVIPWTDVVTAIAAICSVGILLFAVGLAWREVRCMDRTREAQLFAELSRRWDEELLIGSRQAVEEYKDGTKLKQALKKLGENKNKKYYVLLSLPDFFEELGLLVNYKCLNPRLAKDMFGTAIQYHYTLYKPTIEFLREKYKDKTIYKFFEDLAKKC
jgi:hypothetical protein